jgi:hypothetical protein
MVDVHTLRKWGTIAHFDVMLNVWILCFWFWANGYSIYLVFGLFCLTFVYAFFALRQKSYLNRKTVDLLIKLDKKAVDWAIKKLEKDPSNKLARSLCPLELKKIRD